MKYFGQKMLYLFMKSLGKLVLCIHTCSLMVFMHSLFYTHITHTASTKVCVVQGDMQVFPFIFTAFIHQLQYFLLKIYSANAKVFWEKNPKVQKLVCFFFFYCTVYVIRRGTKRIHLYFNVTCLRSKIIVTVTSIEKNAR